MQSGKLSKALPFLTRYMLKDLLESVRRVSMQLEILFFLLGGKTREQEVL